MLMDRVDRRLAAMLSADEVGYSRLMAEDEDGTVCRLAGRFVVYDSQSSPASTNAISTTCRSTGVATAACGQRLCARVGTPVKHRALRKYRAGTLGAWAIQVANGRSREVPTLVESEMSPVGNGGFSDDGLYRIVPATGTRE